MKADLHYHGLIGMHEPYLTKQGYTGKNLMGLALDCAAKRGIEMIGIVSEQFEIPKYSEHDRFNYLLRETRKLPKEEYSHDKLGEKDIAFCVERKKDGKRLFVLNGQTVIVMDEGKRFDHLAIGSSQVPNKRSLKDTLNYCYDHGLISIAEHPFFQKHFGVGGKNLANFIDCYDAIEGHNSQLIFAKKANKQAQEFAEKWGIPWVATSDAHRIEDVGISSIVLDSNMLNISNERRLLKSLRTIVRTKSFRQDVHYESIFGWFNWVGKFGMSEVRKRILGR